MAKKKAGEVNKTQAIRDYKSANPDQKPKAISEALVKQGVEVTPGYVSTILSNSKRKPTSGRRGRPKGSKNVKAVRAVGTAKKAVGRPSKAAAASGSEVSVNSLLKMKTLISQVGGIDEAKSALSTLEKLMDD